MSLLKLVNGMLLIRTLGLGLPLMLRLIDLASSIETNQAGYASIQKTNSFMEEAQKMVIKEAVSKVADPSTKLEQRESSKIKSN